MKDEKELKPASMRVRDAAEALLTIVLEQVCTLPLLMRVLRPTLLHKLKVVTRLNLCGLLFKGIRNINFFRVRTLTGLKLLPERIKITRSSGKN
jgi:hypothetical protein